MIKDVIKLAIENGWEPSWVESRYAFAEVPYRRDVPLSSVYLEPSFWQALGKALGWADNLWATTADDATKTHWLLEWHNFIDHLAEGKSADEFFADLLTRKEGV